MKLARRPTTASWASITTHFFSTSAGFSETVDLVFMTAFRGKARRRGNYRRPRGMSTAFRRVRAPQRLILQRLWTIGNMIPPLASPRPPGLDDRGREQHRRPSLVHLAKGDRRARDQGHDAERGLEQRQAADQDRQDTARRAQPPRSKG